MCWHFDKHPCCREHNGKKCCPEEQILEGPWRLPVKQYALQALLTLIFTSSRRPEWRLFFSMIYDRVPKLRGDIHRVGTLGSSDRVASKIQWNNLGAVLSKKQKSDSHLRRND